MSLQKATSGIVTNTLKESIQKRNLEITHEAEDKKFTEGANKQQKNSKTTFYLESDIFENNKNESACSENMQEVSYLQQDGKHTPEPIRKKQNNPQKSDVVDSEGRTLLHRLAMFGRTEAVRRLLEKGVHPDRTDNSGKTALHLAVEYNHSETVKELLKAGANVNARTKIGRTPLSFSFFKNGTTSESWKIIVVHGGII